ncbi:hypothetical protein [Actinacidiphila sp. ITFR-21]|uniref:hypothetical protein n=1 Tax=Actinacidiphila sp. ITFR-21 TaxID=3075199 RepID=UPI00288ABF1A|nr:hypothetical protein [Streptomyces sp. ITFR-21]WNI17558.1 hypothetical protein RLT57_19910 [Streptomyces sp. ITFR-21]WNI17698.1 hypothetical protein RLT57_20625 [Streptomyces sp. ITFR-21]
MMGFYVDKRAPGIAVVWEGGTGFQLRRFRADPDYGEVTILGGAATDENLNMRRKATPDNVQAHIGAIFDRLEKEEITLKEPAE